MHTKRNYLKKRKSRTRTRTRTRTRSRNKNRSRQRKCNKTMKNKKCFMKGGG